MANRYYLTIVEIDTGAVVYENVFFTKAGIAEELEDWHPEDYCYTVETITDKELEATL